MSDPLGELRGEVEAAAAELAGASEPTSASELAGTSEPATASEPANARRPANLGVRLDRPPKPDLGDYSTNAAMVLAPQLGAQPREIAERLGELLAERLGDQLASTAVAGPGFLNLYMSDAWCRTSLGRMLAAEESFGRAGEDLDYAGAPQQERILIEFVSANPTGPLTVASGRHAAYGDALARILAFSGHRVEREYYVNDHGGQVARLGESIQARARDEEPPEGGYLGDYVRRLAAEIPNAAQAPTEELSRAGVELMAAGARTTLERFGVPFDRFFSERSLHDSGAIEKALARLEQLGHVYSADGALWLRSTPFGDDKDRVLRRSSGELTYLAADIAYHEDKRAREVDRVIDVLGADHHGYVERMRAAWSALGGDVARLELPIMQLVNLLEAGQRVAMSKREGEFVTLDDLIDDIGVDAARFFLLQRSHDTAIDLDLALAREQSPENPVYYVQYAHARIASILRRAGEERVRAALAADVAASAEQPHPSARSLLARLLDLPAEVAVAAERRAPHRLAAYGHEVAQAFSAFYRDCRVVGAAEEGGDEDLRLALSVAAERVLSRTLGLLGVSAPEEM